MFIGRTDVEAETPIIWPPDAKSWLIGKDPDAGRNWEQEKKGTTEDEMVGWHNQLNRHAFGWTLGIGDRQGGLECFSSWGSKELVMTEWLNWTEDHTDPQIKLRQSGSRTHAPPYYNMFPLQSNIRLAALNSSGTDLYQPVRYNLPTLHPMLSEFQTFVLHSSNRFILL